MNIVDVDSIVDVYSLGTKNMSTVKTWLKIIEIQVKTCTSILW